MNIWQLQDLRDMNDKTNEKVDALNKGFDEIIKKLEKINKDLEWLVESKKIEAETRDIGKK